MFSERLNNEKWFVCGQCSAVSSHCTFDRLATLFSGVNNKNCWTMFSRVQLLNINRLVGPLLFQIKYRLSDDYPDIFHIIPDTGQVRLMKAIDREVKSQYTVTVTASDRGTPTLTSTTTLTIKVLDINDNPPIFTSRVYRRTISEGVAIGTIIMAVEARDADIGVNGQVRYQILHGNELGLFSIDIVNGAIKLAKPLNREANETIKLTVVARDQGKKQLSEQAEVVLVLTDVNDNAPTIQPKKMVAHVLEVRLHDIIRQSI